MTYVIIALVIVAVFSFVGSWICYMVTNLLVPLRVTDEQELLGLDVSQHGETALGIELLGGAQSNGHATPEALVTSAS